MSKCKIIKVNDNYHLIGFKSQLISLDTENYKLSKKNCDEIFEAKGIFDVLEFEVKVVTEGCRCKFGSFRTFEHPCEDECQRNSYLDPKLDDEGCLILK